MCICHTLYFNHLRCFTTCICFKKCNASCVLNFNHSRYYFKTCILIFQNVICYNQALLDLMLKKNAHSFGPCRVLWHRKHLIILIKLCRALRRKKMFTHLIYVLNIFYGVSNISYSKQQTNVQTTRRYNQTSHEHIFTGSSLLTSSMVFLHGQKVGKEGTHKLGRCISQLVMP